MASKPNPAIPFPHARQRGPEGPPHDSACPPRRESPEWPPSIDTLCVERLQRAILTGTYGFDASRVASKLVKFERQLFENADVPRKRAGSGGA